MALVESVPNVSEGRRLEVVDRLAAALESVPGAHLLDRTSDPSHNRSVFTLAGEGGPVADALERLVAAALREIDMEEQSGEHPRIGAVDVVPFVPLGETTLEECVVLARDFGRRIATRFELPVYLYAAAATRPERVKLADVRRGQYEGLRERDRDPRPRAGLRPGADPPARRGDLRRGAARSSSPGTSTSPRTTSSWPSGSPTGSANRRAGCRPSRRRASSSRSSGAPRCR